MTVTVAEAKDPVVLLVDDLEEVLEVNRAALSAADFQTIAVQSLGDAMVVLRESPRIDLVMTDVHLSPPAHDRSGLELARYVREHHAGVPVVGYSALFDADELAGEAGLFDTFWEKASGDYRAFGEFLQQCRRLAAGDRPGPEMLLASRRRMPEPTLEVGELRSEVTKLARSVRQVEDRLDVVVDQTVGQDRVAWTVLGVLGALIGLLAGLVALGFGIEKLVGG